jgi:hypothetical protein
MTGPEHYRKAEKLMEWVTSTKHEPDEEAPIIAAAQVHATLALAAAFGAARRVDGAS